MLRRRSCLVMNPWMAAILGTFQIVWVIYGLLIASRNVVMWNVIAIVINYLTVGHMCTFVTEKGDANHCCWRPRLPNLIQINNGRVRWNRVRSVRYLNRKT
jgi:hypothetical protein